MDQVVFIENDAMVSSRVRSRFIDRSRVCLKGPVDGFSNRQFFHAPFLFSTYQRCFEISCSKNSALRFFWSSL